MRSKLRVAHYDDASTARCVSRDGLAPTHRNTREQQIAWMSEAQIGVVPVLRACITSFRTTEAEIHWVVDEMNRLFFQDAEQTMSNQAAAVPV